MSATAGWPWTVAVGLLGLQKNTRPAPFDASIILSMSMRSLPSKPTSLTGVPIFFAVSRGVSKDGQAVTSGRVGEVKARTACSRISPEPGPSSTFSCLAENFCAIAAMSAALGLPGVERIAVRLGELPDDGVEHVLARPERVLVARDADGHGDGGHRHARRVDLPASRPRAAIHSARVVGVRGRLDAEESPTGQRHSCLLDSLWGLTPPPDAKFRTQCYTHSMPL